jgi:hypothetical protein
MEGTGQGRCAIENRQLSSFCLHIVIDAQRGASKN